MAKLTEEQIEEEMILRDYLLDFPTNELVDLLLPRLTHNEKAEIFEELRKEGWDGYKS